MERGKGQSVCGAEASSRTMGGGAKANRKLVWSDSSEMEAEKGIRQAIGYPMATVFGYVCADRQYRE